MRSSIRLFVLALLIGSCTRTCGRSRHLGPEKVVEAYLDTALNMNSPQDREKLLQYTTGRLKDAIASASEESILNAYVNRHYDLQAFSILERRDRTPRETEITFLLKYKDLGVSENRPADTSSFPITTTENTVALIREKEVWYIRDVIKAQTSFIFPESAEGTISAKPGPGIDTPDDVNTFNEEAPSEE